MAGYVKKPVNHKYDTFKSGSDAVTNGLFLVPDFSGGTASKPVGDAEGLVVFVENEIDQPVMEGTDDADFSVDTGDYLKVKPAAEGEWYVTTAIGTATLAKGDECAVGAGGLVFAIADLTAAAFTNFHTTFIVQDVTTLFGDDALVLVAKLK